MSTFSIFQYTLAPNQLYFNQPFVTELNFSLHFNFKASTLVEMQTHRTSLSSSTRENNNVI
jgi:3-hydroxyacyl-CoA dehydrogenase/enoyl-CoA hydratase/3-hydroxybutyryl-CoA epimerase/enoyl-CoA isomerase